MAWNCDADGGFAGTFIMDVTLRLSRSGTEYSETWTADNFDPSGTVIPELHVEGLVRAMRITVD